MTVISDIVTDLISDIVVDLIPDGAGTVLEVQYDSLVSASLVTSDFPLLTGNLLEWLDQSGNGRDATQAIVASQMTVGTDAGKQSAATDDTDDFMNIPFSYDWTNLPFTIVIVASRLSSAGLKGLITNRNSNGTGAWFTFQQNAEPSNFMAVERTGGNLGLSFGFDARNQGRQVYEYSHNTITGRDQVYLNGVLINDVATINIGGVSNSLRMATQAFNIRSWGGFLNEYQIRSGVFNAAERASNFAGLNTKWLP